MVRPRPGPVNFNGSMAPYGALIALDCARTYPRWPSPSVAKDGHGSYSLEEHCRAITNGRRPKRFFGIEWSTDELGVEEYLCPPMVSDFIPKHTRAP